MTPPRGGSRTDVSRSLSTIPPPRCVNAAGPKLRTAWAAHACRAFLCRVTQGVAVGFLTGRVAAAGRGLQAVLVQDCDMTAGIADQLAPSQRTGGTSNACTPHAQKLGQSV